MFRILPGLAGLALLACTPPADGPGDDSADTDVSDEQPAEDTGMADTDAGTDTDGPDAGTDTDGPDDSGSDTDTGPLPADTGPHPSSYVPGSQGLNNHGFELADPSGGPAYWTIAHGTAVQGPPATGTAPEVMSVVSITPEATGTTTLSSDPFGWAFTGRTYDVGVDATLACATDGTLALHIAGTEVASVSIPGGLDWERITMQVTASEDGRLQVVLTVPDPPCDTMFDDVSVLGLP